MKGRIIFKGGVGSGNFGHSGRPGKVGGSGNYGIPVSDVEEIIDILGLSEYALDDEFALRKFEDAWLRGADSDAKQAIVDQYRSFPELKDIRLYQMYQLTRTTNKSFEEFKNTPIKLWRGGRPIFGDTFATFTLSKGTADDYASKREGLYSVTIKPKDLVGFAATGATEAFVPEFTKDWDMVNVVQES